MNKLLSILILTMILLVSLVSALNPDRDRSNDGYLNDSLFHIVDNIEGSGSERGLNGVLVVHGDSLSVGGWTVGGGNPLYSDAQKTFGDVSMSLNGTNDDEITHVMNTFNDTFVGKCKMSIRFTDESPMGVRIRDGTPSNVNVGLDSGQSSTLYACNDDVAQICSGNIGITFDTFVNLTFNWTGTDVMLYVNESILLHNFSGKTGLDSIAFFTQGTGFTNMDIDELKCFDNEEPEAIIVTDTTPPTSASPSINNSNPRINEDVLLSILAQDETELSTVSFAHNQSGTLINVSLQDASGTSFNATATLSVTLIKNNVIGFQWSINDTSGNQVQTAVDTFTIVNTPPQTPIILFPTASLLTNQIPLDLNVTFLNDADGDAITITYYINGTVNATSSSNVTLDASSNVYQLNVDLNDGEASSGNASVVFEIDIDNPLVSLIVPTPVNNSFSTSIIQVFNLSITEQNLDTITLNFNGTNETGFVNDFNNFFSLTKNTMAEGLFFYQIHVNDTVGNEFISDLLFFTVDNTSPTIIYTLPTDDNLTIRTDLTGNIDILGFNINLITANLTVFNLTDEIIFQDVNTGLSESTFTFTNTFSSIFTDQPNADYRFRSCFIDSVDIETCEDVEMELNIVPAPPLITGFATTGTSGILVRAGTAAISGAVILSVIVLLVAPILKTIRRKRK